jgi:hypothetical protein
MREIHANHPEVKKELWGGALWRDGHFISAVSKILGDTKPW